LKKDLKITIGLLLKFIVPAVLLIYIFRSQTRLLEVYQILTSCRIQDLVIAFLLLAITRIQVAFRLYFLTSNYLKSNILLILKDVFIANLLNTILPIGSGEIYRIKSLAGNKQLIAKSAALVTLDRFLGIVAILTIGIIAVLFSADYFKSYNFSIFIYLLIGLFFFFVLAGIFLNKMQLKNRFLRDVKIFFTFMYEHPRKAAGLYLYSISIIAISILSIFFVSRSLDWKIGVLDFFLFYPFVLVVSSIPISIGGLGVREVANIAAFGLVGVSKAQCVSLGLMQYGLMLAISTIGFILFLLKIED
jgi:uncharacterized membrane protein YbhN (UPF0104 family)